MEKNFIEKQVAAIREQVGDGKVLLGLSGGVDSSVCAALIHKAIGANLICVFVNHGLLRKGEFEQVQEVFKGQFGMNLIAVDAEDRFLDKLAGVADPEKKRKIIGEEFVRVFEEEAKKLGKVEFLAQGTILPDIIESGTDGKNKLVKSHHNVGGLPANIGFKGSSSPSAASTNSRFARSVAHSVCPTSSSTVSPSPAPASASGSSAKSPARSSPSFAMRTSSSARKSKRQATAPRCGSTLQSSTTACPRALTRQAAGPTST